MIQEMALVDFSLTFLYLQNSISVHSSVVSLKTQGPIIAQGPWISKILQHAKSVQLHDTGDVLLLLRLRNNKIVVKVKCTDKNCAILREIYELLPVTRVRTVRVFTEYLITLGHLLRTNRLRAYNL